MFIFILSLSALFIAGCAAFFSIKGLTILFAGSAVSVAVMASSLEVGKLVAASFLHQQWRNISWALKAYLCSAVVILMLVTSLGIFGFLTKAYQEHSVKVVGYETAIKGYANQEKILKDEIDENNKRIEALGAIRKDQEARLTAAGNYKAPREQAYKAINSADLEIKEKESRQKELRKQVGELEMQSVAAEGDMNSKTDLGAFKFVAAAFGTDVDTAVKWFILSLVFVFDPLAVSLVLALNKLIEDHYMKEEVPIAKEKSPQEWTDEECLQYARVINEKRKKLAAVSDSYREIYEEISTEKPVTQDTLNAIMEANPVVCSGDQPESKPSVTLNPDNSITIKH